MSECSMSITFWKFAIYHRHHGAWRRWLQCAFAVEYQLSCAVSAPQSGPNTGGSLSAPLAADLGKKHHRHAVQSGRLAGGSAVFLKSIDGTTDHLRSEGDTFRDALRLQGTCPSPAPTMST